MDVFLPSEIKKTNLNVLEPCRSRECRERTWFNETGHRITAGLTALLLVLLVTDRKFVIFGPEADVN